MKPLHLDCHEQFPPHTMVDANEGVLSTPYDLYILGLCPCQPESWLWHVVAIFGETSAAGSNISTIRLLGDILIWGFPKMGVPPKMVRDNFIKMDDLGVPLFQETPICLGSLATNCPDSNHE